MTSLVYTPLVRGRAIELAGSRLWRKRLLPVGQVDYKGRKLQFTREYLQDLARAFLAKAYDQVPFQLAGADNRHTNDVERTAGEVVDADVDDSGLWITVRPTDRGEKVLQENPSLGVSARIVEDYARSDGQYFKAAVQHVLATLDPRIPALGPWQAIEASNSGEIVIDLSGYQFDGMLGGLDATVTEEDTTGSVLDELLDEPGALESWAEGDRPDIDTVISAYLGDPAPEPYPHLDDLSALSASLDLSDDGGPPTSIQLVNDTYGPGTAEAIAARGAPHMVNALAREIDRSSRSAALDDYRKSKGGNRRAEGDILSLAEAYAVIGTAGSAVEAANEPGFDRVIELAAYEGTASLCGRPDALGGCSNPQHLAGCAHNVQAAASRGYSPADSAAWQGTLRRYSQIPAADADGRAWRNGQGEIATYSDHVEALSGVRTRREGLFEQGPRTRPELASIQRGGPDYPHSTRATARALAAQVGLSTAADHQAQRDAWKAEHARREAAAGPGSRRMNHPDYRWASLQAQREQARQAARQPVSLSNSNSGYVTEIYGEDVTSAVCGSLSGGFGGIR